MVLKNLFTGQQWRDRENRLMDVGIGEERVRCGKSNMELILPYVK